MQGLMTSITGRAVKQNKIGIEAVNIRDYTLDKHKKVDDYPYGGGAGMVMRPDALGDALDSIKNPGKIIYFSPRGATLNQKMVREFVAQPDAIYTLLCGRYEGIDERIIEEYFPSRRHPT